MFARILLLFAFCYFVSVNEGFSFPPDKVETSKKKEKKENKQERNKKNKKKSSTGEKESEELLSSPSTKECSPISLEKKIFTPLRTTIATHKANKKTLASPEVRKIGLEIVESTSHFLKYTFNNRVIYFAPSLFDWNAMVLTQDKKGLRYETNLERALRKCAPVAYKGICDFIPVDKLDKKQTKNILNQQSQYGIEMHHLTQREGKENEINGAENNPLLSLTRVGHKSSNARIILAKKTDGTFTIVAKNLTKPQAKEKVKKDEIISTNNLHFRKGSSKIDRGTFGKLRDEFWEELAKQEIKRRNSEEKNNEEPHIPLPVRSPNGESLESSIEEN